MSKFKVAPVHPHHARRALQDGGKAIASPTSGAKIRNAAPVYPGMRNRRADPAATIVAPVDQQRRRRDANVIRSPVNVVASGSLDYSGRR